MSQTQLLKLECVVGENTGEASVESRVLLNQRAKKIADIHARLLDLSADVVDCQVMVQGILHKQIFYVGEDDRVHHQAEDVPFTVFVDVPGGAAGMSAHVTGKIAKLSHTLVEQCELCQRAILQFVVKVTEDCKVQVVLNPAGPLVRAEVVVGETTQVTPVENVVELEREAVKVRDIRVHLEGITAEVCEDQVLFHGTLCKQVFFIATNHQEYHQEERVPFTGVAMIPGVRPGMNVTIRPTILRVDKFLISGKCIRQRIILATFVKVTETVELNVAEQVTGPLVLAKRVIATAARQVLVECVAELTVQAKKVHEIQARVTDLACEVIPNKVIITGNLHKQIFFVGPDDVVHHQGEDIPFSTFVDVPGAKPGMCCTIDGLVEHITWHLFDIAGSDSDVYRASDPYVEDDGCPLFCRLAQKTVVQLTVAVSEEQQIHVATVPVSAAAGIAAAGAATAL